MLLQSLFLTLELVLLSTDTIAFGSSIRSDNANLTYHGGRLMVDPITIYVTWVGPWSENSKEALRNAIRSLSSSDDHRHSELPTLSGWWKIATQYNDSNQRPVSSKISLSTTECYVSIANASVELIESTVSKQCSDVLPEDPNGIYHAVVGSDLDSTGVYKCFGRFEGNGGGRTYLFARQPREDEYCNLWRRFGGLAEAPNGDTGLDSLISRVLASSAERATNIDTIGWKDDSGGTISSLCPSPTGLTDGNSPVIEENGVSWNLVGINGSRFLVQQLWSRENSNCALQIIAKCRSIKPVDKPTGLISEGLIVNHSVGLQPYPPARNCLWLLDVPTAKIFRVTVNFMVLSITDKLNFYECPILPRASGRVDSCEVLRSMTGASSRIVLPDFVPTNLILEFKTSADEQAAGSLGWEIEYKAGFCNGTTVASARSGSISDGSPEGSKYLGLRECRWVLNAKKGTEVRLKFTRFDTIQGRDVLTVYQGNDKLRGSILESFSGRYSILPNRTYSGPVLLVFTTQTGDGDGWAANFEMDHPESESQRRSSRRNLVAIISGASCLMGLSCLLCGACLIRRSYSETTASETTTRNPCNVILF